MKVKPFYFFCSFVNLFLSLIDSSVLANKQLSVQPVINVFNCKDVNLAKYQIQVNVSTQYRYINYIL